MRNALGYLVTVVAALCWGASGVSADYLMEHHGIELTLISFSACSSRESSPLPTFSRARAGYPIVTENWCPHLATGESS